MRCKQCGNELVRGFTFCLECGLSVPDEMLEESGLPPRNIDTGPKTRGVGETAERVEEDSAQPDLAPEDFSSEQKGDLKPRYVGGGEDDRGAALKPQFIGGDTGVGGRDLKPKLMGLGEETSGKALKPQYIGGGDDDRGRGEQVKVVLQETSSETDSVTEKLVFCPNCGMRMQHNPNICDVCGMLLGNKPENVPKASSGMPLFNTDGDAFSGGFGGLGDLGEFGGISDLDGLSDDDISRADSFASGNFDPLFNNSPSDLGSLSEQLAGFSAVNSNAIGVTENTKIRQTAPEKGKDLEVADFMLTDDLSSESVPLSTEGVPVVGDYSMDDNPGDDLDLDPFGFVGMSMDEAPDEPFLKNRSGLGASSAAFEKRLDAPVLDNIAPKFTRASDPEPIIPKVAGIEEIAPPAVKKAEKPEENAPEAALEEIRAESKAAAPAANKAAESGATKKCYACGHIMPAIDRFCPFCGRSTFGAPNPNHEARQAENAPAPKKRSILPFVLILIIAVAAAIFGTMYFTKSGIFAAEAETIDNVQLTVSNFVRR